MKKPRHMKKLHQMRMDELLALPSFSTRAILNAVQVFGGCFRDPKGELWGTCLFGTEWGRFPAVLLAERTGVSEEALGKRSTLRGCIDICDNDRLKGWAQDELEPDAPISLNISIHRKVVARACADLFRGDLLEAGFGNGKHGFSLAWPTPLSSNASHLVVIQREDDGMLLGVAMVPARLAS